MQKAISKVSCSPGLMTVTLASGETFSSRSRTYDLTIENLLRATFPAENTDESEAVASTEQTFHTQVHSKAS